MSATRRNAAELLTGAAVIAIAAGFLAYAIAGTGRAGASGYPLKARFDRIDGLAIGADVRLAGVKVGQVTGETIDPQTFQAVVTFSMRNDIKLPKDSSAQVTTAGLLGGSVLSVVPGGATATIPPGGTVTITQSAVSLEDLLGKFIFNVSDLTKAVQQKILPTK
ncbi:MAG: outer membrane lipid asymmetry maintenance protein MlaD [Rhodospirillales bacterium]|nr:outer membrane lipid asymmetry maintenance protein MlaD [Rhodospirillales bacterium]